MGCGLLTRDVSECERRVLMLINVRGKFTIRSFAVLAVLAALAVIGAVPASAHELTLAQATTNCAQYCVSVSADQLTTGEMDSIKYNLILTSTTGGPTVTASGEFDFTVDDTGTFSANMVCFSWPTPTGSLSDNYTITGTATLTTPSDTSSISIDLSGGNDSVTCGPTPPGKNFSIGPSSMEGDLHISPGDWISGGYDFKFVSGSHPATAYTVVATVTVPVVCPDNSVENIVITLGAPGQLNGGGGATYTYNIPANDTTKHATGDANSILSWDGAVQAPATLCGGNVGRNQKGAIFNANVSQNPPAGLVDWQFKYRDPNAKGKGNVNCTDASDPRRNDAATCGASWSQTVRDP
jgi:hypothetical protein